VHATGARSGAGLGLRVVLVSAHPLTGRRKPHNSLYIIDDRGQIVDRYDKMFCSGDPSEKTGDLAHYTPGDHFSDFSIKGVRCGPLICHDYRYPGLYREYDAGAHASCSTPTTPATSRPTVSRRCRTKWETNSGSSTRGERSPGSSCRRLTGHVGELRDKV
jgi:predicted amidohydrolase